MKRVLILGAGGSPAVNFVRSLRQSPDKFYLVGTDCDKYYLQRSEADENHLAPRADEDDYVDFLNYLIKKTKIEFLLFSKTSLITFKFEQIISFPVFI